MTDHQFNKVAFIEFSDELDAILESGVCGINRAMSLATTASRIGTDACYDPKFKDLGIALVTHAETLAAMVVFQAQTPLEAVNQFRLNVINAA